MIMPFPCGLNVYITVEAVTLLGFALVAATSIIANATMAKRKKSGSANKPAQPGAVQNGQQPKTGNANGSTAQQNPLTPAPPKELDTRPESSPYGSPSCKVPFANPLTVPNDVLLRSPKLHAAFESQLPELPEIPDDVGHILVHYLHTGTYESLKPKEEESPAKQISELRTSIRAYATARTYDLPELMRLAEKKIEKYGNTLTLPHLLEVTKDAHPTLSEADTWFLGYLKGRIRPHLEDPKSLLTSNLLDQISSILSPNRVLLRTVLEMFCERMNTKPEPPAVAPKPANLTGAKTSSTQTPAANTSSAPALPVRPKAVPRDDLSPLKKKATPWPSADEAALASWGREGTPEPVAQEVVSTPAPLPRQIPAAEPTPAPTPKIEDQIKAAIEAEIKPAPAALDSPFRPSTPSSPFRPSTPVRSKRDRRDSAKVIPMTPELEVLPVKETEPIADPFLKPRSFPPVLRQADSGFWESPSEHEQLKESTHSIVEIEPEYHVVKPATPEPIRVHELQAVPEIQEAVKGVETRDFAPVPVVADKKEILIISEPELPLAPEVSSKDPLDAFPETEPEFDQVSELHPEPEPEVQTQHHLQPVLDPKGLEKISEESLQPEEPKEVEAAPKVEAVQPETDKVAPPSTDPQSNTGLTVQEVAQDPPVDATPAHEEPKPEAPQTLADRVPDHHHAAGPATTAPVEPVSEPSKKSPSAADLEAQPEHLPAADADKKVAAVAPADDTPPLKSAVIQQTINASAATPERQRSWRKRFLRVPVLFRQSM
ncbi:hypothetical protein QBC34DRAFT_182481 [Podospora aff. communis PSN243]|uniref:Uncharacterized protein n=1 Tax=Podospora aff. communis PSN243 TaxID=3040156 RepID=A0AAV9G9U3_9PEZI|nr:hypothetical protein QBC34DRAFT_182481 [Podospora aff. communis PSN243]